MRIKESRHPEHIWPPLEAPRVKLIIPLNQFREPKAQRRRRPTATQPNLWNSGVVDVVKGVSELLIHDNRAFDCENQVLERDPDQTYDLKEIF